MVLVFSFAFSSFASCFPLLISSGDRFELLVGERGAREKPGAGGGVRGVKCEDASGWVPQGRRNRCCSDNPSPPEAQGEYAMYSPEIYRATAKCVLREPSMSTLCYRLNLVVLWDDVASGKHCVSRCHL